MKKASGKKSAGRRASGQQDDPAMRPVEGDCSGLIWRDARSGSFRIAGLGWNDPREPYRRLPERKDDPLPATVIKPSSRSAGVQVCFKTDSHRIAVRVSRVNDGAGIPIMTHVGTFGLDCYLWNGGRFTFNAATKVDFLKGDYDSLLVDQRSSTPAAGMRDVLIHFPIYSTVKKLQIGLERGAKIQVPRPFAMKGRVVVYGTSITQGGCASRPGMTWTNILSRWLNVEFINLGLAGAGHGQAVIARRMAEIEDPALLVLDYEANAASVEGRFESTLPPFVEVLREAHPTTPLLLISGIPFAKHLFNQPWTERRQARAKLQRDFVAARRRAGDRNIHFLDGSKFLGEDGDDCTVDGGHPTDLGFYRMAEAIYPTFAELLFGKRQGGGRRVSGKRGDKRSI